MLKNLFTIAWRNIRKDKTYSAINILGLTIGITCSVFLLLYILHELSYDRYHKKADTLYRVVSTIKEPDNAFTWAVAQIPLADELRENYPEVKNVVRFFNLGRTLYKNGDKEFYEENFYLADSTTFDMFDYVFLDGDPNTALDNPKSIVLTKDIAIKYFGKEDAIGQAFQNQQGDVYTVTAVIENVPLNSHFIFDALISRTTMPDYQGSWGNFGVFTYLQLPEGYDLAKMDSSLVKVIKEKVDPIFEQYGITIRYDLQPITDIHLHSKIQDEAEAGGDISYIYIFAAVAAFMIIIASINYMNLATARSFSRAKEVGIRKVMGSERGMLMLQFLTESVLIALIALIASLMLIYGLLPFFNQLSNKQLPYSYVTQPIVLLSLIGIVVFVGIVGGSYPAFYLSGFNPATVLKGKVSSKGGNAFLRKFLVVLQFSISIFMLISTFVVYDQLQYMREKDLGFNREQIIRIAMPGKELVGKSNVLAERMRQTPGVEIAGTSDSSPGFGIGKNLMQVEDNDGKLSERGVDLFQADFDFVKTLGMTIVEGRDFSRDIISDTTYAVLVNEAMVRRMSWENPIGKKFVLGGNNNSIEKRVVGVVRDYHQNSLYEVIEPLMIILKSKNSYLFVKTRDSDVRESIAAIENTWNEVNPSFPMEYVFLDQDFNSQYKSDEKRSQLFTAFSFLTITISCLGLLGLAAFTTEQRYKEIGIRKVIGASIRSLLVLVSGEFFILVGISMVLAFPAAWYFTDGWLQNFAYRITLKGEWVTFVVAALLAFGITAITVGYHIIRAASANPVNALRDE